MRADGPVVEAWVAVRSAKDDVLVRRTAAAAEQAVVDDRVVVAGLGVGPEHRGREVGQPEVLVAKARRPGGGQLKLTAIDEDRIGDHAERDLIAAAEQTRTGQVVAARVSGRTDAVVEVAAEVIAGAKPGRLDVDARQHRPAPLVIRIAALRRAGLRADEARSCRRVVSAR